MSKGNEFNYDTLYAKSAPKQPPRAATVSRAKYDFAVAYPDPESLPLEELVESLQDGLTNEGKELAVYPHQMGYPPLREYVARKLARDRGMNVTADDIILADGSSQPLHMVGESLLDPGDVVLTEKFAYVGTLGMLRRFDADIRGIDCDDDGMLPESIEQEIVRATSQGRKPKLIYTIPTFQNPLGWTMSLERRIQLVELSQKYDVPILEDDCYVDLRYEGDSVPAIYSLDNTGRVIYVASFSKIIAPGMRLGYLVGPSGFLDVARATKSGGGVNQFAAFAVHRYALDGLDEHIEETKNIQREKRDAMLAALGENFGTEAKWSHPDGGLYIWLEMSPNVDLVSLQQIAFDADVGYSAGVSFSADGEEGKNCARLCFGYNTPSEIHEGIARLAEVFAKAGILSK
ncbi:MAG: hypothetical protein CL896_02875 [Dehalococcoidia bacterium]|nr:hypothetical protein [Dehalococcoidia bacterium]|tara:strand:+ start:2672 stop:3880 length:1209 start_codon:yes stop_codon:yes gene_type:complete